MSSVLCRLFTDIRNLTPDTCLFAFPIEGEPPYPGVHILADDIDSFIIAQHFKIAVIRIQPAIEYFFDLNFTLLKPDAARCFFSSISGVTFHFNFDDWCFQFKTLFIRCQLKITTR